MQVGPTNQRPFLGQRRIYATMKWASPNLTALKVCSEAFELDSLFYAYDGDNNHRYLGKEHLTSRRIDATRAAMLPLGVALVFAGGLGFWIRDGNRASDECRSYGGLERPAFEGTRVDWSWSRLDWLCVFTDSDTGAIEQTRPPLGWDLERRQPRR